MKIAYRKKNNKIMNIAPAKLIVLSFAAAVLIGALLLNLPIASKDGRSIGFFNALFTATSATCVTGLVVADTATQWSLFGQLVIMFLIQTGGLGIVTLATFFSVLLGRKVSLKSIVLAQESLGRFSFEGILALVRKVVIFTLAVESTGAVLLALSFIPRYGSKGIYMALFHAVSAFNNAGFDLIGNYRSLTGFNGDPIVIYTVAALIITGGLGFLVWEDLYAFKQNKSLYLHTKVVLFTSACLLVLGTLFFLLTEYNNPATMGKLTLFERINSAFFHAVTCRTAGFNSLPLESMREISKVGTIILMFIGAAPGSTGGGIKVTTFSLILIAVLSQIKGSNENIVFKRRVPQHVVNKALVISVLSLGLIITVTSLMMAAGETKPFLDLLYEATSAFGTVGLSSAFTPSLTGLSKLLLTVTMFLGRVGPLSFAIALTLKANSRHTDTVYPEGKIVVG